MNMIINDENWAYQALCAESDMDGFHPDTGDNPKQIKKVCQSCPVREVCLEDALQFESSHAGARYGIYGGLTVRERRPLVKARRELLQARAA